MNPVPEVLTSLANIRTDEETKEEAVNLFLKAKDYLAHRIRHNAVFEIYTAVNDCLSFLDFYQVQIENSWLF